jgi:hypothetical protein
MRNTTKLKAVLQDYDIDLSLKDTEEIAMTIVDKKSGSYTIFENKSYSALISKAYSFANKKRKTGEPNT